MFNATQVGDSTESQKLMLPDDYVDNGFLRIPLQEAKAELESLPLLSERRKQWLRRRTIVFDDKHNRIFELPPNHRFSEIGESTLVIPVTNEAGETYDYHSFTPRFPSHFRYARICGKAIFLNETAITARPYTQDRPLHVWSNALNWLKAGRVGICILEPSEDDALESVAWLSAESYSHGENSFDYSWCDYGERVLVPRRMEH